MAGKTHLPWWPVFVLTLLIPLQDSAGWETDWSRAFDANGYVRETPLLWQQPGYLGQNEEWMFTNLLHLRQNFRWFPSYSVNAGLELKQRAWVGDGADVMLAQSELFTLQDPYFNGSTTMANNDSTAVLDLAVDRLWIDWMVGSLEVRVGRQRIAWGTNLVWNPTDLFNPTSPLDFDNEEKPGADAVRVQYYLGPNSQLDIAAAPGTAVDSSVIAGRLKLNALDYDWILIGGSRKTETVAGFAWAGDVVGGGFRGEALYAMPRDAHPDSSPGYLTASLSSDYTWSNGFYLQGSVLYNQEGTTKPAGGEWMLYSLQRGQLTPARWSWMGQVSKDITPLLHGDLMFIQNPTDRSWYVGPSLRWSARTNLDITGMGLIFGGSDGTEFGDNSQLAMVMAKYSW